MARTVDFYQVYFEDDQFSELYNFAVPYFNENLTVYFENSIIAELVPQCKADLIGVASWRLAKKRGDRIQVRKPLTLESITENEYDIAILTPRSNSHQPLAMAAYWHGRAWTEGVAALKPWFKEKGIRIKGELSKTVYENHFIATREIYQEYVKDILIPCMGFMDGKEVFMQDSGYKKKLAHEKAALKEKLGIDYWPIAPFILERLFSIWIEGKPFKIISL